ncbi:hypothetical protein HPB50_000519 [Hyalomma asiaticum]|uniref:Uncharacterized protein n=1 Tax=Hyalomma asiaticum TaxID=266040 RepID=A0ACB7T045_HYAAI|nr:hypothetical protein HPB50_000519 [Hyalomma asiaticum]
MNGEAGCVTPLLWYQHHHLVQPCHTDSLTPLRNHQRMLAYGIRLVNVSQNLANFAPLHASPNDSLKTRLQCTWAIGPAARRVVLFPHAHGALEDKSGRARRKKTPRHACHTDVGAAW